MAFEIEEGVVTVNAEVNRTGIRAAAESAGREAGASLEKGVRKGADDSARSNKGQYDSILRKAFTPNPNMFAALRAPFAAALSTPVSAAVITVAGIAAAAFIGAFVTALATAGLGAVFLGIGAAALLGAKKDREAAEKDLTRAEERVRKAEERAKSGTAASKRNLADATAALAKAQEAVNDSKAFAGLDSSLSKLGKTLQEVGARAASPLIRPLTTAFQALEKSVIKIEPLLRQIFTALAPAIPALTAGIAGFVEEFLKVLTADPGTLNGMRDALVAIGAELPALGMLLGQVFALFASNENNVRNIGILFNILKFGIASFASTIVALSAVLDALVIAWHAVQDAVTAAWRWIVGTAVPGIVGAWNTLISSGASLLAWFQALPGRIIGFIQSLPGRVRSIFVQMFDLVTTAIGFGIGKAVALMISMPGRIVSAIASIPSRVASIFNSVRSTMSSIATGAINAAVSIFTTLPGRAASAISAIRGRIQGVFSGAGGWLVSAGRSIIQGVISGIGSAIGGAVSAARRAAQNIVSGFKSALSIGSPSKVLAKEVGRWIPAGIGVGIEANTQDVLRPLQELSKLAGNFPNFSLGGSTGGSDGASLGVRSSGSGGSGMTLSVGNIQVSVSGSVTGDPREAGRIIAAEIVSGLGGASLARGGR